MARVRKSMSAQPMRVARQLLVLVSVFVSAEAASEPICADRPGKANPTCTVPEGHFQLETGLADWIRDDGETTLIVGATAIKYGLTDHSTIDVDVTPYVRSSGRSGIGDTLVRYKHRLTSEDAPIKVALYPFVKLPTAKRPIGNGKVEAGIAAPIDYDIPRTKLRLTLGPEVDWLADEDGRGHHAAMVQVASLGWDASESWNLSAELWGQWDWDPLGTKRQLSADGAVAYLVREDLQLDAGANFGLNKQTPDVELYAGISKRF